MRCEKTELPVESCGHCRATESPVRWGAKYPAVCSLCLGSIEVGVEVKWDLAGTGVIHAGHRIA